MLDGEKLGEMRLRAGTRSPVVRMKLTPKWWADMRDERLGAAMVAVWGIVPTAAFRVTRARFDAVLEIPAEQTLLAYLEQREALRRAVAAVGETGRRH